MSKLTAGVMRLLTVRYNPQPDERPFMSRVETRNDGDLEVSIAVPSDRESERFFGVRLAHRGMQPVWIQVDNQTRESVRPDLISIDPSYYTPLEAAYLNHFALGKRLLSFGLLAWMFLPLLPLVPFKLIGARFANQRMDAFFKEHGFRAGPIQPGTKREGFVFTGLDEGNKTVHVQLVADDHVYELDFSVDVPGLALGGDASDPADAGSLEELDEQSLRAWLEQQPRCTTNKSGTVEGDPLNLVVAGSRATVLRCFGARWDEVEATTISTAWKTAKSFVLGAEYRYSPVSSLYHDGRAQDLALQRARASINERLHLRLWRTQRGFKGQRVWIGQVSRDIGVRFTLKAWNLTTHKIDPDVDEARDYVIDDLMAAKRAAVVGHVGGVEAAPPSAPRHNLTGDQYFTDGGRALVILAKTRTEAKFFPKT
jgi:hypothetical protein